VTSREIVAAAVLAGIPAAAATAAEVLPGAARGLRPDAAPRRLAGG
jgi:hypothetical protein